LTQWEGFHLYVASHKFANWLLQGKSTGTYRTKTFISGKKLSKTGTSITVEIRMWYDQCTGSESAFIFMGWILICIENVDPDLDPGRQNDPQKKRKNE
jgi:hypothetical protein